MSEEFNPIDFAIDSAREAYDQQHDRAYGGPGLAFLAYGMNVHDTLREHNRTDATDDAIKAYLKEVVRLLH